MSKRYYVAPIIGDGSEENPFRAKVHDYATNMIVADIPTDQNGHPISTWAICCVDTDDHAPLIADHTITALPQFAMDAKVSAMHTPTKASMVASLRARGIPTDFIGNADGYREVIRGIGQMNNPHFDENAGSWLI